MIVGNPQAQWIQNNYPDIWQDKSDILFYFIYKALKLSKGEVGYIVSNAFLFSDKAKKLRNYILRDGRLSKIVNFEQYLVFEDASITTGIFIFSKNHEDIKAIVLKEKNYSVDDVITIINDNDNAFAVDLKENNVFALVSNTIANLNERIDGKHAKLGNLCHVGSGMQTAANEVFCFSELPLQFPKEYIKKQLVGENISRYSLMDQPDYLLYFEDIDAFENLPVSIQEHLTNHKTELSDRATVKNEGRVWWRYSRPMHKEYYHLPKIWCSYRGKDNAFVLDETGDYIGLTNTTVIFDTNPDISIKYVLALLNSKLLNDRYKSIGKQTGSGVFEYFPNGVGKLPIPKIDLADQQPFITLVDKMIALHSELRNRRQRFLELVSDNLGINITEKHFDDCKEFKDFLEILQKQKRPLPHAEQPQWKEPFIQCKSEVETIRENIRQTDADIDQMVYELYGLTEGK